MTKMSAKAKTDEVKSIILRFGKENNFVTWKNSPITRYSPFVHF